MKVIAHFVERRCNDPQETAAMLQHRLAAIVYRNQEQPLVEFAFYLNDGAEALVLYDAASSEQIDFAIKRDPLFPYGRVDADLVVPTQSIVDEVQGHIGQAVCARDLQTMNSPRHKSKPDGTYWLVRKEVMPYSPLLSEATQRDILQRTLLAFAPGPELESLELADINPLGKPVGLLFMEGTLELVQRYVEACAVFPDIEAAFIQLATPRQAFDSAVRKIHTLRRQPRVSWAPEKTQTTGWTESRRSELWRTQREMIQ